MKYMTGHQVLEICTCMLLSATGFSAPSTFVATTNIQNNNQPVLLSPPNSISLFESFISYIGLLFSRNKRFKKIYTFVDSDIESIYELNITINETFESWLEEQKRFSFDSILENIGGVGFKYNDVAEGAVIASPSKDHPNYYYQWTRDAAITISSLVEFLEDNIDSIGDKNMKRVFLGIESYIKNSYDLQRIDNLSGKWETLDGLGEPKFMVDSTAFNESWGRPQRDGPGLRVITLTNYINFLLDNDFDFQTPKLKSFDFVYQEILKPDLSYIMKNWNKNGFDLWEEVDSYHLFTSLTLLKALKNGIKISEKFNDEEFCTKLRETFIALRAFILFDSGFKSLNVPYLIETPSLLYLGKRCGLDIGSLLATLRAHDIDDPSDIIDIPFSVEDSAVLSTLFALVNDMKFRYPINHEDGTFSKGVALGRYPEDIYDGYGLSEGNPWFIATATASEVLFNLIYLLYKNGNDLIIPKDQFFFYSSIVNLNPNMKSDEVIMPFGSEAFIKTTLSLLRYADSFLEVIHKHVAEGGHMSEQFNKYNGFMEGAEDLTWSYGSFWSAVRWRRKANQVVDLVLKS